MAKQRTAVIRAREPEDSAALNQLLNQPGVLPGIAQLPHRSDAWRAERLARNDILLSLVGTIDGQMVVVGGLNQGGGRMGHIADVYLAVHQDFQGQGLGRQMMAELMDFVLNWAPFIHRVELDLWADNPHALTLYESFGFQLEGRQRDAGFHGGQYVDNLTMGWLRTEN